MSVVGCTSAILQPVSLIGGAGYFINSLSVHRYVGSFPTGIWQISLKLDYQQDKDRPGQIIGVFIVLRQTYDILAKFIKQLTQRGHKLKDLNFPNFQWSLDIIINYSGGMVPIIINFYVADKHALWQQMYYVASNFYIVLRMFTYVHMVVS